MGKYDAAARTAKSLIAKKGGPVTLVRLSGAAFDPVTQRDTPAEQSWPVTAVALTTKKRSEEYVAGTLQKDLAVRFLIDGGAPVRPRIGDRVLYAGNVWTIFDLNALEPAGDGAVYFDCHAEA